MFLTNLKNIKVSEQCCPYLYVLYVFDDKFKNIQKII